MEQSLPIAANLLYQQASIVADAVLAEQRRTGSVPNVPADFQKKFYAFLDRITGHLMEDKDNFFGYFLFQMVKDIRFDMASPTGTNFKGTRYHLYFNPMLFLPLSPEQMESTIKHEILHVVSLHLIRAKELRQQYSKLAVNLAMDVVVNTYLDHLPPFSTTLEWVNMNYALLLKPFESLEYYVDKIQGALDLRTDKKDLPESDSDSDESIAVSYDHKSMSTFFHDFFHVSMSTFFQNILAQLNLKKIKPFWGGLYLREECYRWVRITLYFISCKKQVFSTKNQKTT